MNKGVGEFADKLFMLSHDKQFLLLQKQETKFLRDLLFMVSSAQGYYIERQLNQKDNDYLKLTIESTYTWATITTILRSRGAYGDLKED